MKDGTIDEWIELAVKNGLLLPQINAVEFNDIVRSRALVKVQKDLENYEWINKHKQFELQTGDKCLMYLDCRKVYCYFRPFIFSEARSILYWNANGMRAYGDHAWHSSRLNHYAQEENWPEPGIEEFFETYDETEWMKGVEFRLLNRLVLREDDGTLYDGEEHVEKFDTIWKWTDWKSDIKHTWDGGGLGIESPVSMEHQRQFLEVFDTAFTTVFTRKPCEAQWSAWKRNKRKREAEEQDQQWREQSERRAAQAEERRKCREMTQEQRYQERRRRMLLKKRESKVLSKEALQSLRMMGVASILANETTRTQNQPKNT